MAAAEIDDLIEEQLESDSPDVSLIVERVLQPLEERWYSVIRRCGGDVQNIAQLALALFQMYPAKQPLNEFTIDKLEPEKIPLLFQFHRSRISNVEMILHKAQVAKAVPEEVLEDAIERVGKLTAALHGSERVLEGLCMFARREFGLEPAPLFRETLSLEILKGKVENRPTHQREYWSVYFHVLKSLSMEGRRRRVDNALGDVFVMKRIVTGAGVRTRAWERDVTLRDWVLNTVTRERTPDVYLEMYSNKLLEPVVAALKDCRDTFFPDLKVCRYLFSFENGVWDAKNLLFTPYRGACVPRGDGSGATEDEAVVGRLEMSARAEREKCAVSHCRRNFPVQMLSPDGRPLLRSSEIAVPSIDKICQLQGIDGEARFMLDAMCGRAFFGNGDERLDKDQMATAFIGRGGTGKSVLLKTMRALMGKDNTVPFKDNISKQFGASTMLDALLVLGMDLRRGECQMSLSDFLLMVEGESLMADRKFKQPDPRPFTASIMIAGQTFPFSESPGGTGELRRRVLVFYFGRAPENQDTSLEIAALEEDLPLACLRFSCAYHELLKKMEEIGCPSVTNYAYTHGSCAEYFRSTSNLIPTHYSSVDIFLEGSSDLFFHEKAFMPLEEIRSLYEEFCERQRARRVGAAFTNTTEGRRMLAPHALRLERRRNCCYPPGERIPFTGMVVVGVLPSKYRGSFEEALRKLRQKLPQGQSAVFQDGETAEPARQRMRFEIPSSSPPTPAAPVVSVSRLLSRQ